MFRSLLALLLCAAVAVAGPFDSPGVSESEVLVWANEVVDFRPTTSGSEIGLATNALGRPDAALVSLGELDQAMIAQQQSPGSITLSMAYAIQNLEGWDFAVFENAGQFFEEPFIFAELAHVEVSSNGVDFVRFPSSSWNVEPGTGTTDTELAADFGRDFAGINATNVNNLAGIHPVGVGTGFDLSELLGVSAGVDLDLNNIKFIRLVDIPGDGSFLDADGQPILDTWPTAGPTGGFDLDAVGTRYPTPEPSNLPIGLMMLAGLLWARRP